MINLPRMGDHPSTYSIQKATLLGNTSQSTASGGASRLLLTGTTGSITQHVMGAFPGGTLASRLGSNEKSKWRPRKIRHFLKAYNPYKS